MNKSESSPALTKKDQRVAEIILRRVIINRRDVLIKGKRKFIKEDIEEIKKAVPSIEGEQIAKIRVIYIKALNNVYPNYPQ
jgi:hypothetical protein